MTLTADVFGARLRPAAEIGERKRESQATAIVRLATEAGVELWHTPSGDPYITVSVDDHREHYPLTSRAAKDYLCRLYFLDAGKAPNASALTDAINTLSGVARFDGDVHDVHVRVAGVAGRYYVDLADAAWRAIEVTPDGWRVVAHPPVRFRRPKGMQALPIPERGGSIEELRPFVNVAGDDDFALVVTWELATLRPTGPYPILVIVSEQGSAKSTSTRTLRRLVDPNDADVRRPPRNSEDLMIAATNGHIVAFDNLSRLPEELSDNLSVLATGGGFSVRTLYTNREEEIFYAQRPVALNGISQFASRGDLVDRAIVVTMPTIPDHRRIDEAQFWSNFESARPRILGALLDAVVVGLRRLPEVHLERKPRMADFALWGVAVEPACPYPVGTFLKAYEGNRQGAVEAVLDGDPVADAVRSMAPWTGTATELLEQVTRRTPDHLTKRKDWYAKPRQVSDALRRIAPALRRVGVDVETGLRIGKRRARLIEIRRLDASAASAASADPDLRGDMTDAGADAGGYSSAGSSAREPNVYRGQDEADAADEVVPHSFQEF